VAAREIFERNDTRTHSPCVRNGFTLSPSTAPDQSIPMHLAEARSAIKATFS
jgi:hypothetical protein